MLKISATLLLGILAVVLFLVGAVAFATPTATPNLVANAGFERPVAAETTSGRLPVTVGNWLAYAQTSGYVPSRVTDPRHSGTRALGVRGPALTFESAYGAIEDLRTGALNLDQDFNFQFWIDPEQGTQSQELLVNWSRLNGAPSFSVTENMTSHSVTFSAWGKTRRVHEELRANSWHRLDLAVNAETDTATLAIDGHMLGTTAPGSPVATGQVTVILGQVHGSESGLSNFYYDDVGLTAS